ncbi:unnamed protein product [Schistosoma curassoni]|uniref:Vinculin n=1 Tax=Schistosoma curassoni TaxID=6186 RepID=A0A183JXT0_9TREM|nr:unnamed protein product [Schistosoma curassoni]
MSFHTKSIERILSPVAQQDAGSGTEIPDLEFRVNVVKLAVENLIKRLTPCMADMIKEVDNRQEELTIQSHSALLLRGIEQVKRLTPILISSLKLHVNTHQNHLPGAAESQANRDFLLSEMSTEIHEIIRGLQLTETDSSELFDDDLAAMHMNKAAFDSRLQFVSDWISDSNCSVAMTAGEKALNQVLNSARNLANLNQTSSNSKAIIHLCDELNDYAQSLIHLRRSGHIASVIELHYNIDETILLMLFVLIYSFDPFLFPVGFNKTLSYAPGCPRTAESRESPLNLSKCSHMATRI